MLNHLQILPQKQYVLLTCEGEKEYLGHEICNSGVLVDQTILQCGYIPLGELSALRKESYYVSLH